MNLLLVRHGETAWNREGRYQGRTDIPLSPEGEAQALRLADRLSDLHIDLAVASPLSRAKSTAEAVLMKQKSPPKLELYDDLLEISHGQWEGKLATEVQLSHAEMFGTWRSQPGRDVPAGPGAETLGDVELRAWRVIEHVCSRLPADGTALIAAHDAVNRTILCKVLGVPLEHVWKFRQSPATLNVLAGTSASELHVVRLNDSEHSAPLLQDAPHRAL